MQVHLAEFLLEVAEELVLIHSAVRILASYGAWYDIQALPALGLGVHLLHLPALLFRLRLVLVFVHGCSPVPNNMAFLNYWLVLSGRLSVVPVLPN